MGLLLIALALTATGCAAPFPEAVTSREAFVKYPGAGQPRDVDIQFGFPLGAPVTVVEVAD